MEINSGILFSLNVSIKTAFKVYLNFLLSQNVMRLAKTYHLT